MCRLLKKVKAQDSNDSGKIEFIHGYSILQVIGIVSQNKDDDTDLMHIEGSHFTIMHMSDNNTQRTRQAV